MKLKTPNKVGEFVKINSEEIWNFIHAQILKDRKQQENNANQLEDEETKVERIKYEFLKKVVQSVSSCFYLNL